MRLIYKLLHLFWYNVFYLRFNFVTKITVWDATPRCLALYEPGCYFHVEDAGNRMLRNAGT